VIIKKLDVSGFEAIFLRILNPIIDAKVGSLVRKGIPKDQVALP